MVLRRAMAQTYTNTFPYCACDKREGVSPFMVVPSVSARRLLVTRPPP
jgi:hypothetical protein